MKRRWLVSLAAPLAVGAACGKPYELPYDRSAETWSTSTPEEQGVDSAVLLRMLDHVESSHEDVHSILIARNGRLVFEVYFYPYEARTKHILASCTKSFTATLIGIAIERGDIASIDERVLELLRGRHFAHPDERKNRITLRHLLSMSSGLDWPDDNGATTGLMNASRDWLQFVLDRPMAHEPGTVWNYNNGGSHVLSEILEERTRMSTFAFACLHLFKPLGISDVVWERNPKGVTTGCAGLYMMPRDMAKLGELYLDGGRWHGRAIVSPKWVEESRQPRSSESYGYQWWIDSDLGLFRAWGYGGQHIAVAPSRNMVVVLTGGIPDRHHYPWHQALYREYLLPAAASEGPLAPNAPLRERLAERVRKAAAPPRPQTSPPLPALASAISGKKFRFRDNALGLRSLALTFEPQRTEALLDWDIRFAKGVFPVGLDRTDRITPIRGGYTSIALRGAWLDEKTFLIDCLNVVLGYRYRFNCHFQGDAVEIDASAVVEGVKELIRGPGST